MPNSPDTLPVLLAGFAFMAWSIASDSMVLGLSDLAWLRFLQPKQNFLNHLATIIWSIGNLSVWLSNETMCQCPNYHNTTNHSRYFWWLELIQSHVYVYIHHKQARTIKILQNIWLALVIEVSLIGQKIIYIWWTGGGAYGVMVIIIGNKHGTMSSNTGWGCLHFT